MCTNVNLGKTRNLRQVRMRHPQCPPSTSSSCADSLDQFTSQAKTLSCCRLFQTASWLHLGKHHMGENQTHVTVQKFPESVSLGKVQIHQNHFHPKNFSSKSTFIKNHFHQKPLSSKTNFIRDHFHQKPISSEHFLSEGPTTRAKTTQSVFVWPATL